MSSRLHLLLDLLTRTSVLLLVTECHHVSSHSPGLGSVPYLPLVTPSSVVHVRRYGLVIHPFPLPVRRPSPLTGVQNDCCLCVLSPVRLKLPDDLNCRVPDCLHVRPPLPVPRPVFPMTSVSVSSTVFLSPSFVPSATLSLQKFADYHLREVTGSLPLLCRSFSRDVNRSSSNVHWTFV